ncbi:MAG: redoxin domain-containing protein [Bacteroidales bacterium]
MESPSVPLIGDPAPSFVAESTNGTIHFPADFGRNWKILFSHPRDFTPVCSTEILELAHAEREFEKLGAKLVVLSSDKLETHFAWKTALEEIDYKDRGPVKINFPLVDDQAYEISDLYGMSHPNAKRGKNIRGVFFIDREDRVRAIYFYPAEIGRNTEETLRTLIALQKTDDDFNVKTPANWYPGDPVMIAYPNTLMEENMKRDDSIYFQYAWFMIFWQNENASSAVP